MVVQKKTHRGGFAGVLARLQTLKKVAVLVGIPSEKASRTAADINNAELLYIHTNGSPLRNIPARPVIEPALKANKEKIMAEYSKAVSAAAEGSDSKLVTALTRTGLAGENAARDWFTDPRNEWAPNTPKTIARKGSSRPLIDTSAMRKAITHVVRNG